ncbi:15473_t:CDS:2, partial [Cetraspora pellucida]
MLPEVVKHVHSYWERPYTKWELITWEDFYADKYPNKTKKESHDSLRCDLDLLISKLEPKTGIYDQALYAMSCVPAELKEEERPGMEFLQCKQKISNKKANSINENDRIKSSKKTKCEILQ